mgnify:FL=1
MNSFEQCVRNMLAVAKVHGLQAARDSWGAAPSVWIEVEKRLLEQQSTISTTTTTANQERIER